MLGMEMFERYWLDLKANVRMFDTENKIAIERERHMIHMISNTSTNTPVIVFSLFWYTLHNARIYVVSNNKITQTKAKNNRWKWYLPTMYTVQIVGIIRSRPLKAFFFKYSMTALPMALRRYFQNSFQGNRTIKEYT